MAIRSTFGKMEKMDLMTNLGHFETLKIDRITNLAILNIKKRKHYQFLQFCTQLLAKMRQPIYKNASTDQFFNSSNCSLDDPEIIDLMPVDRIIDRSDARRLVCTYCTQYTYYKLNIEYAVHAYKTILPSN